MKRTFYLLTALLLALSCSKNEKPDGNDSTIVAPPAAKDVAVVTLPSDSPLGLYKWTAGDKILINGTVFTLTSGAGTAVGTFKGKELKDKLFTVSAPVAVTGTDQFLAQGFENQVQVGNGSAQHIPPCLIMEDVSAYDQITLSKQWAESKGGSFRSIGVVALNLTLPGDAGAITSITLEAAGVKFPIVATGARESDQLSLSLQQVSAASGPVKAYIAVPDKAVSILADPGCKISVTGDKSYNTIVSQALSIGGGLLTEITVSDASLWNEYGAVQGKGTQASPYILTTPEDLEQMGELAGKGKTTYFALGADIDMKNVLGWEPLNTESPYNKAVHFDGKGHTISNFICTAPEYPSFFGVVNGTVKDVIFDKAHIEGNGKAGVIGGYLSSTGLTATLSGIRVTNSEVIADNYAGGLGGQVAEGVTITDCHVKDTKVFADLSERAGGVIGQIGNSSNAVKAVISGCSAENVTVRAQKNVGGFVGVCYSDITASSASGHVTTTLENTKEVSTGGFVGHLENGNVTKCSSATVVDVTLAGRSIGGFVGTFKDGRIEQCCSSGAVSSIGRNTGGFVGLIQASSAAATIVNCYATGNVSANSYNGGFMGLVDGKDFDVLVENCYAAGTVSATAFAAGGFVGVQSSQHIQIVHCAAWNPAVTPASYGEANWSSGAFSGVTYPLSTITGCYRNPSMNLTAIWVPAADYSHPDVSPTAPLIKQDGTPSKATSTANGQDGYPHFAYHGHVAPGKTLSQLASSTLGWSSSVWDFSGALPVLK